MDLLKKLRVQNTDGYESRDQLPEDELLALRDPQRRQNGVGGEQGWQGREMTRMTVVTEAWQAQCWHL